MARFRLTYLGAFHHITARAIEGLNIFSNRHLKVLLLDILKEETRKFKIKIFAYCIMDNHYHLILQNNNGRMSDFIRNVDGAYARSYRNLHGGSGYVFQDRFHSTIIQNVEYLINAVKYVLVNPVRAGIEQNAFKYKYSSINDYFRPHFSGEFIDRRVVEKYFLSEENFKKSIFVYEPKDFIIRKCSYGDYLGRKSMEQTIQKRFERRKGKKAYTPNMRRGEFISENRVLKLFEEQYRIKIKNININRADGKRLRGNLLVMLRDLAGMNYKEINRSILFKDLKYKTLSNIYGRIKKNRKDVQRGNLKVALTERKTR